MFETLEEKTRREIDADLAAGGRLAQDRDGLNLTAGRGIVAREFPMKSGFANVDYLHCLDRGAGGAVEAKAEGSRIGGEED
jgi:hypothetical protein